MKCPNCPDAVLVMSDRRGVEIDYCPTCRGVWLDRGELDKLMQLDDATQSARPPEPPRRDNYGSDNNQGYGQYGKRRKSWLNEIFD